MDHINLDKRDNRIANLRLATPAQNNFNHPAKSGCSSRLKGVCWNKDSKKWQAGIKVAGKSYYLGLYDTEESAHAAYIAKAQELFGEFARAA